MSSSDNEISKALALAIGWPRVLVCKGFLRDDVEVWVKERHHDSDWRVFDYRDWNVIGPIAAKFDAFPKRLASMEGWWADVFGKDARFADTPQKAIALAVIGETK
jgi:hypothetical protein